MPRRLHYLDCLWGGVYGQQVRQRGLTKTYTLLQHLARLEKQANYQPPRCCTIQPCVRASAPAVSFAHIHSSSTHAPLNVEPGSARVIASACRNIADPLPSALVLPSKIQLLNVIFLGGCVGLGLRGAGRLAWSVRITCGEASAG
jgi:hypothetical protein